MVERQSAGRPPGPAPDPQVLDGIFRALGDRTRRDMLRRLSGRAHTITELAEPCDMSFAAASKHVRVLERAGLVRRTVRGREHHCELEAAPLAGAQGWLAFYQQFWNSRLDALEKELRAGPTKKTTGRR